MYCVAYYGVFLSTLVHPLLRTLTHWNVLSFVLLVADGIHKKFCRKRKKRELEKQESKAKVPSTRRCKKSKVTDAATHTTSVAAK